MVDKRQLLGMTLEELKGVASEVGLPAYAAKQMADWIYKKKITRISEMTNIAVAKRALLEDSFEIGAYPPSEYQKSKDGTIKYLYAAGPGRFVESVYIPTDDRATLCVSSQVGCKMNCLFCMTGKQGFTANLGNTHGPVWICVEPEAYHGFNHRCDERLETLFRGERMSSGRKSALALSYGTSFLDAG